MPSTPPPPPPPYAPPPVPPVVDLTAPAAPPVEGWAEVPTALPVAPPPVAWDASAAPPVAPPPVAWDASAAPPVAPPDDPSLPTQYAPPITTDPADPTAPSLWAEPAASAEAPEERARVGGIRDDQLPGRLDVHQLSQWFNKRKVLERCSLSMEPGEVTALIGPSGCGKSTFLRALNRMHELVPGAELSGQVLLNGVDIYGVDMSPTEVRLRIGMVF
ncbi:MAG: ATP-binding cassette domain-containing protein, partial [Actinomycetota bacterium]